MAKPLVSFCVLAYNQEAYVREAVNGAFAQTYSPMEIILSDDCSTDRTFEIMREMAASYRGKHTVVLNRNSGNLGLAAHISKLFSMMTGEFFAGAAGDDVALPERTEKLMAAFREGGESVQCVWSNARIINAQSHAHDLFWEEGEGSRVNAEVVFFSTTRVPGILGATAAYRKSVFDFFGPLASGILQEDLVMAFRCRLLGSIMYLAEPLVLYRRHGANMYDYDSHSCRLASGDVGQRRSLALMHRQRISDLYKAFDARRLSTVEFLYFTAISFWIRLLGLSPDRLWNQEPFDGDGWMQRAYARVFKFSRGVDRRLQNVVFRCGSPRLKSSLSGHSTKGNAERNPDQPGS
jgi:glycosyltransferase involved in cell wall biosynthesis